MGIKSWQLFFPSNLNDDTTKLECAPASLALVLHRHCSRGQELYCHNTEDNRDAVVSQASCRMDVNHEISKFTRGEVGGIRRLPYRWQRTEDALGDYFEGL